jgi:SAM-dependent methyltransferase
MSFQQHKRNWESLGRLDPLWAILSVPEHRFGRWDVDVFMQSGVAEVNALLQTLERYEPPIRRKRALDFGCGVGRLTRALAAHFERCDGVDISSEMVRQARELNHDIPNAHFQTNSESLALFENDAFDFIYTSIVLQHIPDRRIILNYISGFVRVLAPGGMLVFQLPVHLPFRHRIQLRPRLYSVLLDVGIPEGVLYRRLNLHPIRMNWIAEADIRAHVGRLQANIIDVELQANPATGYTSGLYFVRKRLA